MADRSLKLNLARRYADALLDLAAEAGSMDKVYDDLLSLSRMLKSSNDLSRITKSRILDRKDTEKALSMLLAKANFNELTMKFVKVIGENRRIEILPEVIEAFFAGKTERSGELSAVVTTAQSLNDKEKQKIEQVLIKKSGKKVNITEKVDPKILGGVKIKIGSRMLDASVAGKLERLRVELEKR